MVRGNRKAFLAAKAKIEFLYLPISLIFTLFNFSRIISTVVYAQYILLKAKLGGDFMEALVELDNQIFPVFNRFGLSGIYRKIKDAMQTVKSKLG
jgi:hypothetical protein